MKAIVMAGGQGSRLRPLTVSRPKPLIPIVNKPVIAHIVAWLKRHGVTHVIVTLQHQAELFQRYLGNGELLGVTLDYVLEDVPLGTAGGARNVWDSGLLEADEPVLIVSGDALTDIDISVMAAFHRQHQAAVTVALHQVYNPLEYGVVNTDVDGRIRQFLEKPGWADVISDLVNTGIYLVQGHVLAEIPPQQFYDFSHDLFPRLLAQSGAVYGVTLPGYWTDVGAPPAYLSANVDMLLNNVHHEPWGRHIGGDIWVGEDVEIAPDARLYGPIYLGNEVQIKGGVVIQGPAVIRDGTVVDNRAFISHSVIWRGCYVGEGAQIQGAIIAKQCVFKARVSVNAGAVVGDKCIVREDAVIHENVKLWPGKDVEAGAVVRESIVWGTQGRKVLFGRFGVTGTVNVDLTPEFAAKLGVVFGASLPKNSIVTINRDMHPSARMIKRAIISGLPAAGVQVLDLRSQPLPVARFFTRISDAMAGVHVRISPHDRRVVDIKLMNAEGLDLGREQERLVERLFFREDFRRAQLDDIGHIEYAQNVGDHYGRAFLAAVDAEVIQKAALTVVIDYAHGAAVDVLEPLLAQLDVNVVALNTRSDPQHLSVLEDVWQHGIEQLGKIVRVVGANLGVRLDVSGEKAFFVDEMGQHVPDDLAAAAMTELLWQQKPGATIALPVDRSQIFEELAASHGGRVLRTKVDLHALMSVAAQEDVDVALDGSGYFIFPAFQPVPDGMYTLIRLLQCLATQQTTFSAVVNSLHPFARLHRVVDCPWESKGSVMRRMNEQASAYQSDTVDGVKFYLQPHQWVLIRPDPDRAILHICAETPTMEATEHLMRAQTIMLDAVIQEVSSSDRP
ncbi:MAG: NTP transferase domain-containing protein [Chloroflexi bacterium]|nr:NTP transferase domain-containing protein [Chloroflexota bacterium]